jgi:hypothetical protein
MADQDENKLDYEVPTQRKATNWLFRIMVIMIVAFVTLAVLGFLLVA